MAILIHASRRHNGRLYQGGAKDLAYLSEGLYHVVVLCADELQPNGETIAPPGVRIVPAPNDDSGNPFTKEQAKIAWDAARIVADEYMVEKSILVSCFQGRNRSGLVMALAIHLLTGESGPWCMNIVRKRVPGAISNVDFVEHLMKLQGTKPTYSGWRPPPRLKT